ncbi:unnamed protein product [Rotaria sp. Silwood2]|nr:unnamed protein product [Rotaria sp. Silwood2]CAF4751031.1 unnamed protein product [Rotaria sp. Silwood2]
MCITKLTTAYVFLLLVGVAILVVISIALNAATLGVINKRFDEIKNENGQTTSKTTVSAGPITTSTTRPPISFNLVDSIRIEDLMNHLNELQRIANNTGNTRAIGTRGFTETVNYIYNYLANNASFKDIFQLMLS